MDARSKESLTVRVVVSSFGGNTKAYFDQIEVLEVLLKALLCWNQSWLRSGCRAMILHWKNTFPAWTLVINSDQLSAFQVLQEKLCDQLVRPRDILECWVLFTGLTITRMERPFTLSQFICKKRLLAHFAGCVWGKHGSGGALCTAVGPLMLTKELFVAR